MKTVWIQLSGLDNVVRAYGRDSEQAVEALTILKSALTELQDALENTYGDRVYSQLILFENAVYKCSFAFQFILTTITNERLRLREKRATDDAKENNVNYLQHHKGILMEVS